MAGIVNLSHVSLSRAVYINHQNNYNNIINIIIIAKMASAMPAKQRLACCGISCRRCLARRKSAARIGVRPLKRRRAAQRRGCCRPRHLVASGGRRSGDGVCTRCRWRPFMIRDVPVIACIVCARRHQASSACAHLQIERQRWQPFYRATAKSTVFLAAEPRT